MVKLKVSVKVETPCTIKDSEIFDTTDTSVSSITISICISLECV